MQCLPGNIPDVRPAGLDRRCCPRFATVRGGFTLIELLIAIVIMAILTTITLVIVGQTTKDDKTAAASREVQAMLEGAKDRALHAREPRGIRFLRSKNDNGIITSMIYIGAPGKFSDGTVTISGANKDRITAPPRWNQLRARGLIPDFARLRLNGTLYTIQGGPGNWRLTKPYVGATPVTISEYQLELAPTVLPGQEPRNLPQNVVIDIDHSELPPLWKSNINFKMDILFSPRGTVIGPNVARGHIHFLITSLVDVTGTPHKAPGDPSKEDAETIVTITTQTGSVSTHSVFSLADPWRSAETGVETK